MRDGTKKMSKRSMSELAYLGQARIEINTLRRAPWPLFATSDPAVVPFPFTESLLDRIPYRCGLHKISMTEPRQSCFFLPMTTSADAQAGHHTADASGLLLTTVAGSATIAVTAAAKA